MVLHSWVEMSLSIIALISNSPNIMNMESMRVFAIPRVKASDFISNGCVSTIILDREKQITFGFTHLLHEEAKTLTRCLKLTLPEMA